MTKYDLGLWNQTYIDQTTGFKIVRGFSELEHDEFRLNYGQLSDGPMPLEEGWIALEDGRRYKYAYTEEFWRHQETGEERGIHMPVPKTGEWQLDKRQHPSENQPKTSGIRAEVSGSSWYYKPEIYSDCPEGWLGEYRALVKGGMSRTDARKAVRKMIKTHLQAVVDYVFDKWRYEGYFVRVYAEGVLIAHEATIIRTVGGACGEYDNQEEVDIKLKNLLRNAIRHAKADRHAKITAELKAVFERSSALLRELERTIPE